jgi:hypothetical protein
VFGVGLLQADSPSKKTLSSPIVPAKMSFASFTHPEEAALAGPCCCVVAADISADSEARRLQVADYLTHSELGRNIACIADWMAFCYWGATAKPSLASRRC